MDVTQLRAQVRRCLAVVATCKAAIRHHRYSSAGERRRMRKRLGEAKAELAELEADCRRLGIALTVQPFGEGETSSWPRTLQS